MLDGKMPAPMPPGSDISERVVSAPIKHQGVRDALLAAFPPLSAAEFDALLAKLR